MSAKAVEADAPDEVSDDAGEAVAEAKADAEEAQATAIELRSTTDVTQRRRGDFDSGQMELIKATVAKGASDAETAMFLELCARYQLDPFAKEIWCAKMGGSGGGVTIMVSRDGLLKLANRSKEFEGMDGDIVRKNDEFTKTHGPEGVSMNHIVKSGDIEERGEIVGAWAVVHREGRRPTYFYAPFDQYKGHDKTPWGKQTDAMILKVAESMALRKAFSISGLVGEDEMTPQLTTVTRPGEGGTPEIEWPEDEQLTENLKKAFNALGYTRAKVRLKVNGRSTEELEALLDELNAEADAGEKVEGEVVDGD